MKHILLYILLGTLWAAGDLRAETAPFAPPAPRQDHLVIQSAQGMHRFTIDIAETPEQQEYGLMNRTGLPRGYGMLFILKQDKDMTMWMKDTPSPLDMLFIDRRGKIVYIAENTTPGSLDMIHASQPVRAVMELAGGTAAMDGIKVGDNVIHPYFKP